MVAAGVAAMAGTRGLAGVALACAADGQWAAIPPGGDWTQDADELKRRARGRAVLTDSPRNADALLVSLNLLPIPEVWNVLELAALVLPDCGGASLDHVGAYLGVEPPDDDGLAARARLINDVFEALVEHVEALGLPTLLTLNRLAIALDWPLRSLFRQLQQQYPESEVHAALANATPIGGWIAQALPRRRKQAERQEPTPAPLDLDGLAAVYAADSRLAQALPHYEPRQEQIRMATIVAGTLNDGGQLLVEAGTGTGKGLAYLIPAALWAVQNGQRVVVSTSTTNLQDQLYEHDVPLVRAALGPEQPLKATVLKGRGNYLCLRRWQLLLHTEELGIEERTLLIKTLFWLPRTQTGDRAELRLTAGEEEVWERISAVTEVCTPTRCSYHRIGVCWLARARRAAEESHIVITNHALLLSDLVQRSQVLPDYDALVLDEAHHLEDEATAQMGWRLGERELINRLEALWSPGHGASGIVPQARAALLLGLGALPAELAAELQGGENSVVQLGFLLRGLFEGFVRVFEESQTRDDATVRINAAIRAGSTWQSLETLWLDAQEQITAVEQLSGALIDDLRELGASHERAKELISELSGQIEYWRDVRRRLQRALQMPTPLALYWLSLVGRQRTVQLNAAPLDVGELLRERLFSRTHASVLTSATLAIDGSFEYIKHRIGLEDADSAALGSSYDYARAALLYVPNDLPDPTQQGYQPLVERAIFDVVTRLRGRALVLFTSHAHLRQTYQALRDALLRERIIVLGQGIDESSRSRLLQAFRNSGRVVLFGTSAFWEGVDVIGDALSCVLVCRLPFSVPTDPIYAARAELFDEPFSQYAVPQAVLRLKQGFGRLIRGPEDRGAVVVLDRRLVTRPYGQTFLRSLPPATLKQGPLSRTSVEVQEWVNEAPLQLTL